MAADSMRMAELTRVSGVPTATIKFYLREGLLQPGRRTAPNQAVYDESHLRRLRLIRALRETGGLGIDTIRRLLEAIADPRNSIVDLMGEVSAALMEPDGPPPQTAAERAVEASVDELLRRLGWEVEPDSPVKRRLAAVLHTYREMCFPDARIEAVIPYAMAVFDLARIEVATSLWSARLGTEVSLENVVSGTVFGERLLGAFRRAAHEHWALQYGAGKSPLPDVASWLPILGADGEG